MRVLVTTFAAAAALSACATTYVPPSVPPPPLWSGAFGMREVAGAVPIAPGGPRGIGDVALQIPMEPVRTARVGQEIRYRGAFGGEEIIPAGTPLIPQQFSLYTQMIYGYAPTGPRVNQNAANDPIEWCTVALPDDNVCLFWEGPERVRFIPVIATGVIIAPSVAHGMPGGMPEILEGAVAIDGPIMRELVVNRFTPASVLMDVRLAHAGASRIEGPLPLPLPPGGTITVQIEGHALTFTRSAVADGAADSVTVAVAPASIFERSAAPTSP